MFSLSGNNYDTATAIIITFIVKNHVNDEDNAKAEAWEKKFLEYLKEYKGKYITISFNAEVGGAS